MIEVLDLPSESIGYYSAAETAQHSADGKNTHGDGIKQLNGFFLNIFLVSLFVNILNKIFNVLQTKTNNNNNMKMDIVEGIPFGYNLQLLAR